MYYPSGSSGVLKCGTCGHSVTKQVGEIEEKIIESLATSNTTMNKTEIANSTQESLTEINNGLSHLLDLGYIGTGGRISQYRLSSKARREYEN